MGENIHRLEVFFLNEKEPWKGGDDNDRFDEFEYAFKWDRLKTK